MSSEYATTRSHKVIETIGKRDELTGLAELLAFREWLGDMLVHQQGDSFVMPGEQLTIVYFNIQNFRGYNERFGFNAGNELLVLVANAIQQAFPGCMAARFGADQFVVVARTHDIVPGIVQVRTAFRAHHKDSSIWLKAGYYAVRPDDNNAGVVCDRAKMACDAIKGRRDVFYREYDNELRHQIALHRYVLDHFDEALEKHWIKIYYQPIVRVATSEVCDEEALARWVDPVEGVIAPVDFISVLEEARLIHRLDLYMVQRTCEDIARLEERGVSQLPVSVNLSRLDFELCDIVAEVIKILEEHDVPRNMLTIEVTESALTGNGEFLKSEIDRFREAGFEVWIDDFGSGYSSLATLKEYNCDLVKIDMAFLEGFSSGSQARIMLAHMISMIKELGMKTLVEGVETAEQFAFLRGIGCGRIQGFLFGRPASLDDSTAAMEKQLYPKMEHDYKRSFYEDIGRVNLIRPNPVKLGDGRYVPSDVAAAIVRRRDGEYEYLNTSDLFVKFLTNVANRGVEESRRIANMQGHPMRDAFVRAFDACVATDNWESYEIPMRGDEAARVHLRKISVVPDSDVAAALMLVDLPTE